MARAGVLYVCSSRLCSTAVDRSRKAGTQRPDALMAAMRSSAAGDMTASQSPPSEPNAFWGAT